MTNSEVGEDVALLATSGYESTNDLINCGRNELEAFVAFRESGFQSTNVLFQVMETRHSTPVSGLRALDVNITCATSSHKEYTGLTYDSHLRHLRLLNPMPVTRFSLKDDISFFYSFDSLTRTKHNVPS